MDKVRSHGQGALTHVDRQDEIGDWIHGYSYPVRRAR
jgi:hypothetical protein